jgi:uncharacterized protein
VTDRVTIDRSGADFLLRAEQWVRAPRDRVFPFFADPFNLERITPPFLHFHVRRVSAPEIREGTRLLYTLRLHGVPVVWRTGIEEWAPPCRFVDRQLAGPYALWHHRHDFEEVDGGTRLLDTVRYRLWCAPLTGTRLFAWVHRDVRRIFEFRQHAIREQFPGGRPAPGEAATL